MKIAPPSSYETFCEHFILSLVFIFMKIFVHKKICFHSIIFFIINLFILYICIIFSCNCLHKTDFAIFAVLPCVTSWAMYLSAKYVWKTSPNKLRGKCMTHTISKHKLFVILVTTVNYCFKAIYYRYCRGPRYASETSYYKKLENEEL